MTDLFGDRDRSPIQRPARAAALETSLDDFERLHAALDGVRQSSTTVRVDRAALARLLRDHSMMAACLNHKES